MTAKPLLSRDPIFSGKRPLTPGLVLFGCCLYVALAAYLIAIDRWTVFAWIILANSTLVGCGALWDIVSHRKR